MCYGRLVVFLGS